MEYQLINKNFEENYIEQLVQAYGADAHKLLNPTINDLEPPTNLDNIDKGARLLNEILSNKGKIAIIVDCDVDGFTSASIFWLYLKELMPDVKIHYYLHEGKQHGLEDLMDKIEGEAEDIDLLVVPDAGSNDEEYHRTLRDVGIPILVLDHHEANQYSKDAIVINNQLSKNYLNKQLTGAGVVYQFCRYLDQLYGKNYADNYLDLACLGIISDMGKVSEPENAYIIKKGLSQVPKNYLFQSFLTKQSYSIGDRVNAISIAFYVTPLINALIRVGTMEEKEKLFLAFIDGRREVPSTKRGEKGLMEDLATQVVRNCTNARVHQNKELDSFLEQIDFRIQDSHLSSDQLLVIELDEEDDLNPSLNGLLAMKCCSRYDKPTLVLRTNNEGIARGSLRGVNNSKLESLKDYLEGTGLCEYCAGHANAAGLGIKESRIQDLVARANQELLQYDFGTTYYKVNFVRQAGASDIEDIIRDIDRYHPIYGQGCPEPLIVIKGITFNKDKVQIMGSNKDTVKIVCNGIAYMMFRAKDFINKIYNFPNDIIALDIVGRANLNEWRGVYTPQIFIDDYNIYDMKFVF